MPNENDDEITPERLTQLRAEASRAARLDRENIALRAGISLDGPVGEAFLDRYQGELSVDAIRAEAAKWNLWAPPAPAATTTPPATDPAAAAQPPAQGQQPAPAATPAPAAPGQPPADPYANVPDAGQQAIRDALAGGTPAGQQPTATPHPTDVAFTEFHDSIAKGTNTRDRAALGVIDRMIVAAAEGDKRVIFDPEAWRREAEATA